MFACLCNFKLFFHLLMLQVIGKSVLLMHHCCLVYDMIFFFFFLNYVTVLFVLAFEIFDHVTSKQCHFCMLHAFY